MGVGFCMWIASDSSTGVKVVAALIGLGVGLLVVLLIAWALSAEEHEATVVAAQPVVMAAPEVLAPTPVAVTPPPVVDLTPQLEAGRALGDSPDEVDAWIEHTRQLLTRHRPGVAGYFAALGSRSFPDERARLDAHLARLETIIRDMA